MKRPSTRIVCVMPPSVVQKLDSTASQLDLSKVKAMQLAIATLHELTSRIGNGATVVLRSESGQESELLIPQIPRVQNG